MKRLVLTTLLGLGIHWLSAQENLYIKVDPSCMDRFEYHINGESKGVEYISYRIKQSDKNFIFFEVGAEATGYQLSAPPVIDCRTLSLSPSFVDRVNRREFNLFIVRKDEIGYNISPVNLATISSFSNNIVRYHTYDTDFQADVSNISTETNLTGLDATNEIYSGGVGINACLKEYYFHKVSKESCKPAIGLVYVPEIGIVKEITGKSNMSAYESTMHLVRINDVSMETYLENICAKQQPITMSDQYAIPEADLVVENTNPILVSNEPVSTPTSFEATTDRFASDGNIISTTKISAKAKKEITANEAPAISSTIKCNETATKDFHVVQQGESMYAIARRYGVRVDQLQEWNNMQQTTLISPCSKLRILPETEVATPENLPKAFATNDLLVAKGGNATTPAWKDNKSKFYEVKKGDTYYNLSQKYGYTLDRFLEMNGIEDESSIKIGQKLQVSDCVCPADSKQTKAPKAYETNTLTPKGATEIAEKKTENKDKKEDKKTVKSPTITFKRQTVHIVSEDETIKSIAAKYGLTADVLAQINYLDANEILIPKQPLFID